MCIDNYNNLNQLFPLLIHVEDKKNVRIKSENVYQNIF